MPLNYLLQLKKSTRRLLREKPSGSDEKNLGKESDGLDDSIESKPIAKVEKIGDLTPIQDFEAMMSRRDNPDWVDKAIKDMKDKILGLLEVSQEKNNYSTVVELLISLRQGCIREQVYFFLSLISVCVFAYVASPIVHL